jgi:hypothetical protein
VLILVDFKPSTINRSERWNGSETYEEFLKVLLEDLWRGKERSSGRFGERAGGRPSPGFCAASEGVRLQDTLHDSTCINTLSMCIYELFEYNG